MFRSRDLDYGVVGNPISTYQGMVELENFLLLDIPENSVFRACMSPQADPVGFAEILDRYTAVIRDPAVSAEQPEDFRGFDSFVEGNFELQYMFYEWSINNRYHIPPEEINAIKFRQATIQWATESLGADMEAKKRLLKVLFNWVEHNQWLKRRASCPNPYVPNNGNMANPGFQAVNGESSLGRLPAVVMSKADARKKRMELMRLKRKSEDDQGLGTDVLQPVMVNRETVESQISACLQRVNLVCKLLLAKVLVQSDVGKPKSGRIVLPKREAESNLPALEKGDKITIAVEEVGTSRVWNMHYRFWLNNNSRMYILEKTGDYVRANGLRAGDMIVLYLDTECSKYMIGYVKNRLAAQNL